MEKGGSEATPDISTNCFSSAKLWKPKYAVVRLVTINSFKFERQIKAAGIKVTLKYYFTLYHSIV